MMQDPRWHPMIIQSGESEQAHLQPILVQLDHNLSEKYIKGYIILQTWVLGLHA